MIPNPVTAILVLPANDGTLSCSRPPEGCIRRRLLPVPGSHRLHSGPRTNPDWTREICCKQVGCNFLIRGLFTMKITRFLPLVVIALHLSAAGTAGMTGTTGTTGMTDEDRENGGRAGARAFPGAAGIPRLTGSLVHSGMRFSFGGRRT